MEIVRTIDEVRSRVKEARLSDKRIGFVPTMGYLHQGHMSLVEISKKHSEFQVMSIFVNRIQFNDPKDFADYPADLERDFKLAESAEVDLVFVPDESEMYHNNLTSVRVDLLTDHLCGAARPGHFEGVFTVVSKLFNIISPDVSVFGQKDIQQAIGIQKMVEDLNFPVKIVIAPTVREKEGLAMSSRNKHLSEENRTNALVIFRSLQKAEELLARGERDTAVIRAAMEKIISSGRPEKIDYISCVACSDLQPVESFQENGVIAAAVFFGGTRLIDNMIIRKENGGVRCVY